METGGTKLKYYFYKLKDVPEDEGKATECMPEWWLRSAPQARQPSGEVEDPTYGMKEARLRSEMIRDVLGEWSFGKGTPPALETGTDVGENAVGSSKKGKKVRKTEKGEKEALLESEKQDPMPKTEWDEKEAFLWSEKQDQMPKT